MKIPSFYLLVVIAFLLAPLGQWLRHQDDPHFFLGLSSSFWTGVSMGISIVCWLGFIAFLVYHVASAREVRE